MRARWLGTVGGMALLTVGAFVGGRVGDAAATSCLEEEVRRVLRMDVPGDVQRLGPSNVRDTARQAAEALGFEVRPPCPAPASSFVLNAATIDTHEDPRLNRLPNVGWSFVLSGHIREDGVAYVERGVTVTQYRGPTPEPEGAEQVTLGIGETRAFRDHQVSIEPEGSDQMSGEALTLYIYANGGTFIVQAISPPERLPDEGKILAMLKQMIR